MRKPARAARFLMCPPDHYGVLYTINPWMDPQSWARDDEDLSEASRHGWTVLYRTLLECGAIIDLVPPVDGLPDLVFTANSAVVLDGTALLARFRYPERQGEEAHFEAAFRLLQARGLVDDVRKPPDGIVLEGAGDCVWDPPRGCFWMGHGLRSDAAACDVVEETFGVEVVALELADPRFYHLDTALCVLPRGEIMYFPAAFTPAGRARIEAKASPRERIDITEDDACRLAANTVCLGDVLVTADCSARLRRILEQRGYRVITMPLDAFRRSGGSAFCLTLRLDCRSAPRRAQMRADAG